jgi:hypothetical protein
MPRKFGEPEIKGLGNCGVPVMPALVATWRHQQYVITQKIVFDAASGCRSSTTLSAHLIDLFYA